MQNFTKVIARAQIFFERFFDREKGVFWDPEKLIRLEISRMGRSGVMTFDERVQRRRIKRGSEKSEKLSTLHVSLMSLPLAPLCCSVASATPLSRQFDLSFPLFRLVTDTPASRYHCRSRKKQETFRKIASDERNVVVFRSFDSIKYFNVFLTIWFFRNINYWYSNKCYGAEESLSK